MTKEKTINLTSDGNASCADSLEINTNSVAEGENGIETVAVNLQQGEKTFTQEQVEALIADRIKRERKVNEALVPVKQLLNRLREKGTISGKSYGEIASDLISKLSLAQEKNSSFVQEQNRKSDEVVLTAENKDGDNSDCNMQASNHEEAKKVEGTTQSQKADTNNTMPDLASLYALRDKYPSLDMNMVFDTDMFKSFAGGKSGSLTEIYEDYCAFLSKLGGNFASLATDYTGASRSPVSSMNSTAFSQMSGTSASFADGLTKQQMEIAKSGGLSYREYAELLSSIPHRKGLR